MAADEQLRLFLGLRVPDVWAGELERWGERELTAGRRVPRGNLHVTLAFLGSRPARELGAIVDALRAAAAGAERPELEPVRYRETRSAGMLVLEDAGGRATRLAGEIQRHLEELGVYRRESRPWLPHVTVVRYRSPPRLRPSLPAVGTLVPSDAAAYLSRLHPSGARYEVLESCPLGEAEPGGRV
ncbi:MAG TPA: 2'-5' RNA ligase family protein [Gaiellaceae bacterium]|nr:2'-5' RNA ligase family protein [Gaiellaceae bacterium]